MRVLLIPLLHAVLPSDRLIWEYCQYTSTDTMIMIAKRGSSAKKILLVDNDRKFLDVACTTLSQFPGLDIHAVKSGRECLSALKEFVPEIVFLDVEMDNMNGLVTARFIKSQFPSVRVFFVTGHSSADISKYFDMESIDGYFAKTDFIELANAGELLDQC